MFVYGSLQVLADVHMCHNSVCVGVRGHFRISSLFPTCSEARYLSVSDDMMHFCQCAMCSKLAGLQCSWPGLLSPLPTHCRGAGIPGTHHGVTFYVGSRNQIQIIRLVEESHLPAEPSHWPECSLSNEGP